MKIRFPKFSKDDVLFGIIGALLVHSITTEIELKKLKENMEHTKKLENLQDDINHKAVEAFKAMDKRMDGVEKDLDDMFIVRGIDH